MLRKITELKDWDRSLAIMSAGASCGEKVIPKLLALDMADSATRAAVASGLGNSGSTEAISPLISMLTDAEPFVRGSADRGLYTLTHRKSAFGVSDMNDARAAKQDWSSFWALHGKGPKIYKAQDCGAE
jgi:HEAT repeat protein